MGEETSSMFYRSVKERQSRNAIILMRDANGDELENEEAIRAHILLFFTDLLSSPSPGCPTIILEPGNGFAQNQAEVICRLPSYDEIRRTMWSIGANKSPGPDGFGSQFFKDAWKIVGVDTCEAIREIFRHGKVLKQLNATFISLVPKVPNPTFVKDLRPISCCNTILKVVTKIIAARIKGMLGDIISDSQGAFVPGRSIAHNSAIATEIVNGYGNQRVSPRCTMKVDLQKAYDYLSWEFIKSALEYFEFPAQLVNLIMECVTTTSFSVIVNGSPEGFFLGKRGLRQGDPLSPYLFVLCMEILSRMLHRAAATAGFKFHPKCKGMNLVHLAFADDLLIFCHGDLHSVRILKSCLDSFFEISGLRVNPDKSTVYTAGCTEELSDSIVQELGFMRGSFPVRYLGTPLSSRRILVHEYNSLYEKIGAYIQSWASRKLSYAGRLQLIKAICTGVNTFWSQSILFPKGAIEKIEAMLKKFLWNGNLTGRKHLVAWDEVTHPYSEGGLEIRELLSWNKSVFAKLWGDIALQNSSIWKRWCLQNHLQGDPHREVRLKRDDTWLWKSIISVRAELDEYVEADGGSIRELDSYLNDRGSLSCAKLYELFRSKGEEVAWGELIWGKTQNKKWAFITWLAARQRLQTGRITRHWLGDDAIACPLCHEADECEDHLWFSCPVIIAVQQIVFTWAGIFCRFPTIREWLSWFANEPPSVRKSKVFQTKLLTLQGLIYFSWIARNRQVFCDEKFDVNNCAAQIISLVRSRVSALCKGKVRVGTRGRGR